MKLTEPSDPPIEYQCEYNKIRPITHKLLFITEIIDQCDAALNVFRLMQDIRTQEPQAQLLFSMAHAFLVFAANVAKVLAPTKKAASATKHRARSMRSDLSLQAADLNPLRRARNHLEHFDERMEKYLEMQIQNTLQKPIVFQAVICSTDGDPRLMALDSGLIYLKLLVSSTWRLSLCEEQFRLQDLMILIARISHAAEQARTSIEAKLDEAQAHLETMFHFDSYPPRVRTNFPSD